MLELIFFIPKDAQKKLMLEFIKPTFLELIATDKMSLFTYTSYPKRLILEVFITEDKSFFEERILTKWKQFLNEEYPYFDTFKTTEVQSLFREFPMEYIKISAHEDASESDPFYSSDSSLLHLDILENLVENEYDFEYSLCLVFTFLYCLGGYSPTVFLERSKELKETLEFYASTKEKLDTEVSAILGENEEEIEKRLDTLLLELSSFYDLSECPTVFSKWKLAYGMLVTEDETVDSSTLFEKFRSQLFFSDPEIYMITAMIIDYHEKGLSRTNLLSYNKYS
jgi:hypothetical protein